jgi:outer membrane protein TolC
MSAMKRLPSLDLGIAVYMSILCFVPCKLARAQVSSGSPAATQASSSSDTSGTYKLEGAGSTGGAHGQNPFYGSVPEGKVTDEVLPLSIKDAMDRGLKNNLGLLLQSDNTLAARGEKWKELSALLPNLSAGINESVAQIDLAAQGFRFKTPGIPKIVGPIGIFQANAYFSQSVFDLHALDRKRGASANESAARYNYKDARELVVLVVGNAYLQTISAAARVETSEAQVETAQALYGKSVDQQNAGVIPAIDSLRARVELQSQQQQLIVARNDYAKQKLALARIVGLPPGQEFILTEKVPYAPLAQMTMEEALQRAYASRADYQAAVQQLRGAQYFRSAATAEHYPSLNVAGDYGDAGIRPGSSHGVFQVGATLSIPIFAGGRAHADTLQAEATLRQSRQQLDNLRAQIDYEIRTALLDLAAAADQVEVARSSVDLSNQTLSQARDRFAAGVADNLEVIQAQEAVAVSNETYISSLYAHNLAKLSLARALGFVEEGVKQYLQSK